MKLMRGMWHSYEQVAETIAWVVILLAVFMTKILPQNILERSSFYLIVGIVLSVLIIAYYVAWKIFSKKQASLVQNITQVIVIGILIYLAKGLGIYFFSLFTLPLIATALTFETLPSIVVVVIACIFIATETILYPSLGPQNLWQIALIIIITIFCRFLALEMKRQQKLTLEAQLKTEAAETRERVGREFIALASHQLLTPLSIIRGFASLVSSGQLGPLNQKQKKATNQIYNNTLRMIHLVEELLTISRIQQARITFNLQTTDLVPLIKRVVSSILPRAKNKNLKVKFQSPNAKSLMVKIDSEKTESALLNLLDNAISYTQKGGIVVEVKKQKRQGKEEAVVSVSDTGVGIPKEFQDRIFQPFFRGKNILDIDKKGTGLGLFVAKSLIEGQGGRMWAESKLNHGSTFYFSLPLI